MPGFRKHPNCVAVSGQWPADTVRPGEGEENQINAEDVIFFRCNRKPCGHGPRAGSRPTPVQRRTFERAAVPLTITQLLSHHIADFRYLDSIGGDMRSLIGGVSALLMEDHSGAD